MRRALKTLLRWRTADKDRVMTVTLFVINREPPVKPPPPVKPEKGGGIITGEGGVGEGPSAGLLVGAAGPAADGSTRAAAVAGAMLGILAAVVSLVWALYKFKPGLIVPGAGPQTGGAGPPAAVDQAMQGNQETPLLALTTAQNGTTSGIAGSATPGQVQTTDVDLANYFSPMTTTTTTMNRGVQADVDSGAGAGWTVTSALATRSPFEEVTQSGSVGLSRSSGTGTMNVGTQTANLQTDMTGGGAVTSNAQYSTYSYESRTVTDSKTRDTSQVLHHQLFRILELRYTLNHPPNLLWRLTAKVPRRRHTT